MHLDPTHDQAVAFGASATDDRPVFMLNLLRFKAEAEDGLTGPEQYGRYAMAAAPHVQRVGAEVVWAGQCDAALIGPVEGEWDVVAIVRYPSRRAFLDMVTDPDYQAITKDRTASLADSRLIPCNEAPLGG